MQTHMISLELAALACGVFCLWHFRRTFAWPVLRVWLAAAALVAASALFSWFIGLSSRYSLVYGSLASGIILLVWLYLCGNILILGDVFNCVWYRRRLDQT